MSEQFEICCVREGTKAVLQVHIPGINKTGQVLLFRVDCEYDWMANLLVEKFNKTLSSTIKNIREEEYEHGLKDARKRKDKRNRNWFASTFIVGYKNPRR